MKRAWYLSQMGLFAATLVLTTIGTVAAQRFYREPPGIAELIEEGRLDDARRALIEFRRREPDNPYALFLHAKVEDDHLRALWMFREVMRLAGSDSTLAARALLERAGITAAGGNLAEAETLYVSLAETYPDTDEAREGLYRLGGISIAMGEPEQAIEQYRQCLIGDSTGARRLYAYAGIMEANVVLERWQDALDAAVVTLAEPDEMSALTPRVLEVMALSWEKLGSSENAARYTERLLENYPYSYQAYAIRERGGSSVGTIGYTDGTVEVADRTPDRLPADESVPVEDAKFSVQVGAFEDQSYALKMLRSLQSSGFDARVNIRTVGGKHFFAVRVGHFVTREEADDMVKRITGATGTRPNVVALESP